jgi:pimeloyl-ACP methyl ester carboxylesterase
MCANAMPIAILYAPGIQELAGQGAIDGVAQRIARILDHQDLDSSAIYEVRVAPSEPYANGSSFAEVREVLRRACGAQQVTHRIYNLDYQPALADQQPESNLFTRMVSVARVWVWMAFVFFRRVLLADSIGANAKTAIVEGAGALLVLTLYLAGLVTGVAYAAIHQVQADPTILHKLHTMIPGTVEPEAKRAYEAVLKVWNGGGSIASGLLVLGSIVGFSFESARCWLKQLIHIFLSFSRYIKDGLGRSACTGKFNDLLEHILEQFPQRIDVISYSMGSLVALDALFPDANAPNHRTSLVSTITTIGCPFDLVRTFWPSYFLGRAVPHKSPEWLNVFSPVDLLGSNFANEDGIGASVTAGINAASTKCADSLRKEGGRRLNPAKNLLYDHAGRRSMSLMNALLFGAYIAHSQYWIHGDHGAESCFGVLVPQLYPTGIHATAI